MCRAMDMAKRKCELYVYIHSFSILQESLLLIHFEKKKKMNNPPPIQRHSGAAPD